MNDPEKKHLGAKLVSSAAAGNLQEIQDLLTSGADPNYLKNEETALMVASMYCHLEMATKLIDSGANVNATNKYGQTPLMLAAKKGYLEVVTKLIESGASMDATDMYGQTPLILAAKKGHLGAVTKLIESGARIDTADMTYGQTALMWAAENGHQEVIVELIESGASMDAADMTYGKTALMWAAENGHLAATTKLIESGASLDAVTPGDRTALMLASKKGHLQIVDLLITATANVDITDTGGKTALMLAAKKGHQQIVCLLIDAKANKDTTDINGRTALLHAAKNFHWDIVNRLIDSGATTLDANDEAGTTALMKAASKGNLEVVTKLIDSKADLNATDEYGDSALMNAIYDNHSEVVSKLIHSGANLDIANQNGETALMLAAKGGKLEIVCKLVDAKAEINMTNENGETAFSLAKKNGYTEVASKLKEPEAESSAVREIAYSELEFGESLGTGGQGVVFKGKWKTRSLVVAIKRVGGKIRHEEAELLNRLSHPNVIAFYGICTEIKPEYFIITELAEGGSLYSLIHEKHCCPGLDESLRWAKEIAEGMKYLHQQKVIHRDLKSQNVLLTASRTTKVGDFGSAKEFDHTTLQTGTGTYRWIAPEVLNGEKVSLSCDVFSYGMVLFELLKHEVPFAGIRHVKVINMVSEGKTPAIPVSVKPYLASLMKCCWQMNPKARPSFEEILVILEKKECPQPVSEIPETPPQDTTDGRPADPAQEESEATYLNLLDLPKLQKALESVAGLWYPLGMQLKVNIKILKNISKKTGDSSTALGMMLNCWLNEMSATSAPTLEILSKSLSHPSIGADTIAQTLLKEKENF